MSSTPRYEINLTHGQMHICLESDDVYFISKQMNQWLKIFLDERYIPAPLPQPAQKPVAQKPAPLPEPPVQPVAPPPPVAVAPVQPPSPPPPVYQDDDYAPPMPKRAKPKPNNIQLPGEPAAYAAHEEPTVAERPLPPSPSQRVPQPPVMEETPPPAYQPSYQETAEVSQEMTDADKDDFETVMDSLMRDLNEDDEEIDAPASARPPVSRPRPMSAPVSAPQPRASRSKSVEAAFEYEQVKLQVGVLDNDEDEVPPEPEEELLQRPIDSLADLCERAHAATSEDYLILSAYFLAFFEAEEKFSLKRVNATLVKSGLTPVNHSVLESAVSSKHLAMVPDLTGTADISEYTLTEQGRQYADSLM